MSPYDLEKGRQIFRHKDERAVRRPFVRRREGPHSSSAERIKAMRIYIFKSETRRGLRAFAGDPAGSKLPNQHGPWTPIGVVRPEADPLHKFSRLSIERAIDGDGFQLWRLSAEAEAPA